MSQQMPEIQVCPTSFVLSSDRIDSNNYTAFDSVRGHQPQQQGYHNGHNSNPHHHLPQPEYMNPYSSQSNSSREDVDSFQAAKEKSRVAAEEFPLPPPSNIYIQRQQQQHAFTQDGQQQYYEQSNPSQQSLAISQLSSPSSTVPAPSPSKHLQAITDQYPHGSLSGGVYNQPPPSQEMQQNSPYPEQPQLQASVVQVPAAFRALPLLSSDLPHTNITVSHSFVRPNDRGKEVLSFIVFVNPGSGKDGWKVEKMYSDVLSLDQRVRNSVGKGVGKRIVNLPEGKLWKDHAPAKVDQRKVSACWGARD